MKIRWLLDKLSDHTKVEIYVSGTLKFIQTKVCKFPEEWMDQEIKDWEWVPIGSGIDSKLRITV